METRNKNRVVMLTAGMTVVLCYRAHVRGLSFECVVSHMCYKGSTEVGVQGFAIRQEARRLRMLILFPPPRTSTERSLITSLNSSPIIPFSKPQLKAGRSITRTEPA